MSRQLIAGVDEVGRGPLVGPVVAAAVILDPAKPIVGLRDSKKLSPKQREALFVQITENALAYGVGQADAVEIDEINILQASLLAMQRAVAKLPVVPALVLVDGNRTPILPMPAEAIIKGDQSVDSIQAASILAKVLRDREVMTYDHAYPGYAFSKHKGYPTKEHLLALKQLGPTPLHRRSFGPVKRLCLEQT